MVGILGVGKRMLIAVSVVVAMYAATFLLAGLHLAHLARDAKHEDQKALSGILLADEMNLGRLEVRQYLAVAAASRDPKTLQSAADSNQHFLDVVKEYKQLLLQNDGGQVEAIKAGFDRFYASGKVIAEAELGNVAGNQPATASAASADFDRYSAALASQLSDFRGQQVAQAHRTTSGIVDHAQSAIDIMIIGGLAASLIAALFGIWIARGVLGETGGEPVYASGVVRRVAGGDLTVEVDVKSGDSGSLLFAVRDMIRKISAIVANIRSVTESITVASHEIASGNADLSRRTEEQASGLQQTTASMEVLLSSVRQNAENARHAYQLAQGSCAVAEQSGATVEKLVTTMTSINESSKMIEDIISVIDGIAFQTNILALNAAVEAARAGEQGRGFAVVAGEVRNLAQRSAAAAREIKQLIASSVERVTVGSRQVKDAADTISDVVTSVQLVASLMKDISATTAEQGTSIENVNRAIVQLDEFIQQNTALVEHAAASAESMEAQAEVLMRTVGSFKLDAATMLSGELSAAEPAVPHHSSQIDSPASPIIAGKPVKSNNGKHDDWKEF